MHLSTNMFLTFISTVTLFLGNARAVAVENTLADRGLSVRCRRDVDFHPIRSTPTSAPMTATAVVRVATPSSVQPRMVLALAQISRTIAQSTSVYANDGNYEALDDASLGHDSHDRARGHTREHKYQIIEHLAETTLRFDKPRWWRRTALNNEIYLIPSPGCDN
jgi:hypothetical protein